VQPVRLGAVGCGFVAERVHLPILSRLPELEVVAVADRDANRLTAVADAFGIPSRYPDADSLIADPSVDAVGVFVPPAEHAPPAIAALEAGRHLLVEKPLAPSLEEADRLADRAAAFAGVATVGFNLRWLDLVLRARELTRRGELGEIEVVRTVLTNGRRFDPEAPEWLLRRELGGGSLIEQGIHHFDLWRFLLDSEVDEVFAVARPEDAGAAVTARMADGILVQTMLSERTTPTNSIEILGTGGCLRLRLTQFDGFELLPATREDSAPRPRARRALATLRGLPRGLAELRAGGHFATSYAEQWRRFAAAVRAREAMAPTLEDGRRALHISLAAVESASTGTPVRLEGAPRPDTVGRPG
jgi:predicted dehydrogenase